MCVGQCDLSLHAVGRCRGGGGGGGGGGKPKSNVKLEYMNNENVWQKRKWINVWNRPTINMRGWNEW